MKAIGQRFRELWSARYEWILMILFCSLLGFLVENIWNYFTNGFVDNRNMFLPFLIGYGVAILLVYLLFGLPTTRKLPLYCLKVVLFTTVAEIALGYVVEWTCGFRLWDYTELPLHLTPYASLLTSLGFMIIVSLFMKVHFTPLMNLFKKWTAHRVVRVLAVILTLLLLADLVVSFARMYNMHGGNEIWLFNRDVYAWFPTKDLVIYGAMFYVFSFLGWCMETVYISWMNKKWTNRGLMKAPICPIYGFGELIGYRLMLLLPQNYILIFFVGMIFCTLFEFLVAKYMIWKSGYLFWDYTNRPFNYKGILCLESSIAWGVIAVVVVGFLHNAIYELLSLIPTDVLALLTIGTFVYMVGDLVYSIRKVKTEGMQAEANNILKVR